MELTGETRIELPRQKVWDMLNDPDVLRACIPGCETLSGTTSEGYSGRIATQLGPFAATFDGGVKLSNVVAGESYSISGEGKDSATGFARGGADVKLRDEGGATLLTYTVKADIGGKLAQLGSRLIDATAKRLADQFFEKFAALAAPKPAPLSFSEVLGPTELAALQAIAGEKSEVRPPTPRPIDPIVPKASDAVVPPVAASPAAAVAAPAAMVPPAPAILATLDTPAVAAAEIRATPPTVITMPKPLSLPISAPAAARPVVRRPPSPRLTPTPPPSPAPTLAATPLPPAIASITPMPAPVMTPPPVAPTRPDGRSPLFWIVVGAVIAAAGIVLFRVAT